MASIVPAILTNDPAVYQQQAGAYPQFAKRIQIDITDGEFVPIPTVTVNDIALPQNVEADLHMMVLRPSEHLQRIIALKPSLVIFHAEAAENLLESINELKKAGIKTGVAMLKSTYPARIRAYIEAVDHVMIFAGELGKQGGTADMLQTEKVGLIRAIKSDVEIGWDGGANLKNIRAINHADIDVINVGSAIAKAQDPAAAYEELAKEAERRGVAL